MAAIMYVQVTGCSVNFVANSFLDYFVSYAEKLSSDQYPVVKGEILRYVITMYGTNLYWNLIIVCIAVKILQLLCIF